MTQNDLRNHHGNGKEENKSDRTDEILDQIQKAVASWSDVSGKNGSLCIFWIISESSEKVELQINRSAKTLRPQRNSVSEELQSTVSVGLTWFVAAIVESSGSAGLSVSQGLHT